MDEKIKEIIEAAVLQVAEELRREQTSLKEQLAEEHDKVQSLEAHLGAAERNKTQALEKQRESFDQNIRGPLTQLIQRISKLEAQQDKYVDRIAELEALRTNDRNNGANINLEKRAEDGIKLPSTTDKDPVKAKEGAFSQPATPALVVNAWTKHDAGRLMVPYPPQLSTVRAMEPPETTISDQTRSSTLNPRAQSFSLPGNPHSKKLSPGSLSIAPAPRVIGLRNDSTGMVSPYFCQDCRRYFSINSWDSLNHEHTCPEKKTSDGDKAKVHRAETGDLKALPLIRSNTLGSLNTPREAFAIRSTTRDLKISLGSGMLPSTQQK